MADECDSVEEFDRIVAEAIAKRDRLSSAQVVNPPPPPPSSLGSPPRAAPQQQAAFRPSPPSGRHGSKGFVVSVFRIKDSLIATRSPFHEALKNSLKAVQGSSWQKDDRCWAFPEDKLESVLEAIKRVPGLNAEIRVSDDLQKAPHAGRTLFPPCQAAQRPVTEHEVQLQGQQQRLSHGQQCSQPIVDGQQSSQPRGSKPFQPQGQQVSQSQGKLCNDFQAQPQRDLPQHQYQQTHQQHHSQPQANHSHQAQQPEGHSQGLQPGLPTGTFTSQPTVRADTKDQASCQPSNPFEAFKHGAPPVHGNGTAAGLAHRGPESRAPAGPLHQQQHQHQHQLQQQQQQHLSYQAPHPLHMSDAEDVGFEILTLRARFLPAMDGRVTVTIQDQEEVRRVMEGIPNVQGEKLPERPPEQQFFKRKAVEACWSFPLTELARVKTALSRTQTVCVRFEDLQPMHQRAMKDCMLRPDDSERFEWLPRDLRQGFLPFQAEGIKFGLRRGGRMLCADEMGLGKTLQAIGLAACYREDWPVLVLVPSALRLHWAINIKRWLHIPEEKIWILVASSSSSAVAGHQFVFEKCPKDKTVDMRGWFNIVSYELIPRVANTSFKVVIADESHYLKNYKAKRTLVCCPRLQKAQRAILLTGTPALARPIDLFKQLESLQPTVYKLKEYGDRYCFGGKSLFGPYTGSSNLDELNALLSSTIMIRRFKKDVLPQLPKKNRDQILLMLPEKAMETVKKTYAQLDKVRKVLDSMSASDEDSARAKEKERNLVTQLYTQTAEAKVGSVIEYISTLLESKTKFLLFAHHKTMMDAIEDHLASDKANKPKWIRIDGNTPHDQRQRLVDKFQNEPEVTVAILGIKAAGVGLTLTQASTVVFAELSWNPGDIVQAEDRAHRIGQEMPVNVYYLHAQGTGDDLMWNILQNKLDNLGRALDGQERSTWSMGTAVADPRQQTLEDMQLWQPKREGGGAPSQAASVHTAGAPSQATAGHTAGAPSMASAGHTAGAPSQAATGHTAGAAQGGQPWPVGWPGEQGQGSSDGVKPQEKRSDFGPSGGTAGGGGRGQGGAQVSSWVGQREGQQLQQRPRGPAQYSGPGTTATYLQPCSTRSSLDRRTHMQKHSGVGGASGMGAASGGGRAPSEERYFSAEECEASSFEDALSYPMSWGDGNTRKRSRKSSSSQHSGSQR